MDMDLVYHFRLIEPNKRVAVGINASKGGQRVLHASLAGLRRELTDRALLQISVRIPSITAKVTLAIHWEALRLWLKGMRLRTRPVAPTRNSTTAINTSNRIDPHVV